MPVRRFPLGGYPTGQIEPTRGSVTFGYGIYGADLHDFLYEVMPANGGSTEADPWGGGYRASSVSFEPFLGDKQPFRPDADITLSDLYDHSVNSERPTMRAIVTYSSVQRDLTPSAKELDPVTNLTHSISIGGEYITLDDEAKLAWYRADGSTTMVGTGWESVKKGLQAGFPVCTQEHTVQWHRVVSPPFQAIIERIGSVNSDAVQYKTLTYPPETVLFLGAEMSHDILSNGSRAWNVTYRFSCRILEAYRVADLSKLTYNSVSYGGWNHFFNPSTGYFAILHVVNGPSIFEKKSFTTPLYTQV